MSNLQNIVTPAFYAAASRTADYIEALGSNGSIEPKLRPLYKRHVADLKRFVTEACSNANIDGLPLDFAKQIIAERREKHLFHKRQDFARRQERAQTQAAAA